MAHLKLLTLIGQIRQQAWDAIIPHGPRTRAANDRLARVALNPQPLPPREAFLVGAGEMAAEIARLAIEADVRGEGGGARIVYETIDDWCGTPWPHKWPLPWPGPDPDPHPWDVALARVVGAVVFASIGSRLGEGELQSAFLEGAERLAVTAAGD